ncbi:biotin--[acetyl-CoA-carboxylase] ligase [Sphingomonas sp. TREG-RG-20F-R18-01]|uniref:biotin--[acetyl-CoA-carboxylase] ligase n=1 Tax=Sphingomonas sp. TREG-RG-20F-R18-01 TaxID=2914982 RepID=UPI001F576A7B|nr:biotin--[acetyl-CoA-carboxylase] ligase [Sphingomonas sp. TREG-RG-20F-R18-01]
MLALARSEIPEGIWLRAERQTGGRGRQGRLWVSPVGNFYGSSVVRVRGGDPAAATLALVAAVALEEVVRAYLPSPVPFPGEGRGPVAQAEVTDRSDRSSNVPLLGPGLRRGSGSERGSGSGNREGVVLKWPNDLLIDGAKISGILLERTGDAIVVGIGVNLAHYPTDTDRRATSLAAHGATPDPADFAETLADTFARWLSIWRGQGLAPVRTRWLERAHPIGTALTARLPDGSATDGLFNGLDSDGALILRLADGTARVIHAGDVFLL